MAEAGKSPLPGPALDTYEAIQRRLEQRDLEDEYLADGRDAAEGELSDSDEEFDAIIEVD